MNITNPRINLPAALKTLQHREKIQLLYTLEQEIKRTIDLFGEVDPVYCSDKVAELSRKYDDLVKEIRK